MKLWCFKLLLLEIIFFNLNESWNVEKIYKLSYNLPNLKFKHYQHFYVTLALLI